MNIKEARKFVNMTQQEVEDEFNIPRRSLQNWEAVSRSCPAYVMNYLMDSYSALHYAKEAESWLNELYTSNVDKSFYEGALKAIQMMGFTVVKGGNGKHFILNRKKL